MRAALFSFIVILYKNQTTDYIYSSILYNNFLGIQFNINKSIILDTVVMKQALFIAFILNINTVLSYINIVKHSSKFISLYDSRLSPMVENMAISKTIEIHSLTKQMERFIYFFCNFSFFFSKR